MSNAIRYYVLPKDDPLRAANILRAAAGLAPIIEITDSATQANDDMPSPSLQARITN